MTKGKPRPNAGSANTANGLQAVLFDEDLAKAAVEEFLVLPIDQVVESEHNARRVYDATELEALALTMKIHGQLVPVNVRRLAPEKYELADGSRRYRALRLLKHPTIKALVKSGQTEAGVRAGAAVINLQRSNLRPYEEALAFQEAIQAGLSMSRVAQAVGRSERSVKDRLKLAKFPAEIGVHIGLTLDLEDAQGLVALQAHPKLLAAAGKALGERDPARGDRPILYVANALVQAGLAWPLGREGDAYAFGNALESPRVAKLLERLPHVALGGANRWNRHVLLLSKEGREEARKLALQVYEEQQKQAKAAQTRGSGLSQGEKAKRRLWAATRTAGLDLMARHLASRTGFGDAIVRAAYQAFLREAGACATSKNEQAFLAAILGGHAPKDPRELVRALPPLVAGLWKRDRLVLDRYVAAVAYLRNREYGGANRWTVPDEALSRLATGKTASEVLAAARASLGVTPPGRPQRAKDGNKGG